MVISTLFGPAYHPITVTPPGKAPDNTLVSFLSGPFGGQRPERGKPPESLMTATQRNLAFANPNTQEGNKDPKMAAKRSPK